MARGNMSDRDTSPGRRDFNPLYLLNQGDVLATAVPGFPTSNLAGLIGSTSWGLWVAALGVTILLLRPTRQPIPLPTTPATTKVATRSRAASKDTSR